MQKPTTSSVKTGKKKSCLTTSKNQLNNVVLNGTFEQHPVQWENYKKKLRDLDPYCKVDDNNPTQVWLVRDSRCAKYITMSVPNFHMILVVSKNTWRRAMPRCISR